MAKVHLQEKNPGDAVDSLRKALTLKPDLIEAQRDLIALHVHAGRVKEALGIAREVQTQRPRESVGYALEGDIYAAVNKWTNAAAAYRAGLKHANSRWLASRVHTALSAGNATADADRFAITWLKEYPKDASFRLYLAQAAGAKKDFIGAAQHYRKLLDLEPNNALVLNNLAWVEGQLRDPMALAHAEKANALAPNQPSIMDTLGVLLMANGDSTRALELLRRASAIAPHVPAIRLNLAKVLINAGQKDAARKELNELAKLGDKFTSHEEVAQLRLGL
jgi:putative PEP-CTERM system TPR-repeat lipoprotein